MFSQSRYQPVVELASILALEREATVQPQLDLDPVPKPHAKDPVEILFEELSSVECKLSCSRQDFVAMPAVQPVLSLTTILNSGGYT